MRRGLIIGAAVLIAVGAAIILPRSCVGAPAVSVPEPPPRAHFDPIQVQDVAQPGLALDGTVVDLHGAPVPGAEVLLAASAQGSILSVSCEDDHLPLALCPARQSAQALQALLERNEGALAPGATTRADAQGRFRFEHLVGVSFTVWAQAPGLGTAVHERAAPGEPVRLMLPDARVLRGEVEDVLGHPVTGAKVWAMSRRAGLPHPAVGNDSGAFEVTGLGEGPFEVLAAAPGFLPQVLHDADAAADRVQFQLERPRTLEVALTRGGKPVEGTVRLRGDHLRREATTKKGVARFELLYPDPLMVTAAGHDGSAAVPRALTLVDETTRVELSLDSAGTVTVSAVDEQGQPVPTPKVTLLTTLDEPLQTALPADGATATLGPVAVGDYHVRVSAPGFLQQDLPVKVKPGSTQVDMTLLRGIVVSGKVLDEYERPLPEVAVWVEPVRESAITDAQGRFTALVPTAGAYSLEVQHSLWGGAKAQVQAPATEVVLRMEPKASAELLITADGLPLEGASVTLVASEEGAAYRSDQPSGSDGRVLMRGLEPGSYQLVAEHPRYLPSEKQTVTLTENGKLKLEVALKPGAVIRGLVTDERGVPLSGVSVASTPDAPTIAHTGADGRFELRPLHEGDTYRLEAHHPRYELMTQPQVAPGADNVTLVMHEKAVVRGRVVDEQGQPVQRFEVDGEAFSTSDGTFEAHVVRTSDRVSFVVASSGFEAEVVDQAHGDDVGTVTLHRSPQVTGVVQSQDGSPVEGAVVSCNACEDVVTSDANGRFTLDHPSGVTDLTVTAKKGRLSGTARLGGDEPHEVVVQLPPLVHLSGRVFLANGQPAAGRALEAFDADRSELVTLVTGADGTYQADVPAGSYRIPVNPGEATVGVPLAFVAVKGSAMTLDLGPVPGSASLTVHVVPQAGRVLWVVPGTPPVGDPPTELFQLPFGQLVYQPPGDTVLVQGLPPGRYTVVWANQHLQTPGGPVVRVVDLGSGPAELTLQ